MVVYPPAAFSLNLLYHAIPKKLPLPERDNLTCFIINIRVGKFASITIHDFD